MANTSEKMKGEIHDAAENVKDPRTTSVGRSRTPRTMSP